MFLFHTFIDFNSFFVVLYLNLTVKDDLLTKKRWGMEQSKQAQTFRRR